MKSAELKPKTNSVFMTVAKPPASAVTPGIDRHTGEVIGFRMQADSQENVESWWDIFTEMARECRDWREHAKRS